MHGDLHWSLIHTDSSLAWATMGENEEDGARELLAAIANV